MIAAANPIGGTYNTALNFNDNVNLTDPILSRFDLLAVVRDEIDEDKDDALATFVINSHIKNHPKIIKCRAEVADENTVGEARVEKENELGQLEQYLHCSDSIASG